MDPLRAGPCMSSCGLTPETRSASARPRACRRPTFPTEVLRKGAWFISNTSQRMFLEQGWSRTWPEPDSKTVQVALTHGASTLLPTWGAWSVCSPRGTCWDKPQISECGLCSEKQTCNCDMLLAHCVASGKKLIVSLASVSHGHQNRFQFLFLRTLILSLCAIKMSPSLRHMMRNFTSEVASGYHLSVPFPSVPDPHEKSNPTYSLGGIS